MRFVGTWVASLVGIVLVTALILGRDTPPRTYEVAAIAEAFQPRYAAALADLEAGGVLYLRTEMRSTPDRDGRLTSTQVVETWVAMDGNVPVARSEESDSDGRLLRALEFEGSTRTLLVDRLAGTESRELTVVTPVQSPAQLLGQLRTRTLGAAVVADRLVQSSDISGLEAARLAGPEPSGVETTIAVTDPLIHLERAVSGDDAAQRVTTERALLQWTVLPAGTPLGERPPEAR